MNKMEKVDLHMHSSASDGIFNPRELMKMAADYGLAAVGVTDHDTISGLPEAQNAAQEYGIELVPGVEISVLQENSEVHILGYYPRYRDRLRDALTEIQDDRYRRMEKIVEKLKNLGFKISPEEVIAEAGNAAPGRMHLARLLLKKKYVHTLDEAFSLYLTRDNQAYVPRQTLTLKQAMDLLNQVEAIPVIAHPGYHDKEIINMLLPMGLKGIEVFHPEHSSAQITYYRQLAFDLRLTITGGSDFHGESKKYANYSLQMAVSALYLRQLKSLLH